MLSLKNIILILLCMLSFSNLFSQKKETLKYIDTDSTQLKLDLYKPEKDDKNKFLSPLIIYVHGGGFADRNRKDGSNLGKYLSEQGMVVASIDYTLYMKDKDYGCNGITSEKIKAIQIVANQIWQATNFLLTQSDALKFNKRQVFLAGTSSGAESILHAAFWNRTQMLTQPNLLPADFKYAGIIAGAGAIMDLNLITKENKIPLFLFHGDKDATVPYATGSHRNCPPNSTGWLMLFGSQSITKHLERLNGSCQLFTIKNGEHKDGDTYFYFEQHYIKRFIEDVILGDTFIRYEVKQIVKKQL